MWIKKYRYFAYNSQVGSTTWFKTIGCKSLEDVRLLLEKDNKHCPVISDPEGFSHNQACLRYTRDEETWTVFVRKDEHVGHLVEDGRCL